MRIILGWLLLPAVLIAAAGAWYLLDPGFGGNRQLASVPQDLPQGELERRVRDYLLANPEVIVEAMRALDERQRTAEETEAQLALAAHRAELFDSPESPVGGNPQGDVTLVEFFDYNCPYCRQVAPVVVRAAQGDRPVRASPADAGRRGHDRHGSCHGDGLPVDLRLLVAGDLSGAVDDWIGLIVRA